MGPIPPHNEPFLTAEERLQRAQGCAVLCCVVIILIAIVGGILLMGFRWQESKGLAQADCRSREP